MHCLECIDTATAHARMIGCPRVSLCQSDKDVEDAPNCIVPTEKTFAIPRTWWV